MNINFKSKTIGIICIMLQITSVHGSREATLPECKHIIEYGVF